MKETANRAFEEMRRVALQRLAGREPRQIAERAGVVFSETEASFLIPSLGRELKLSWPDCRFRPSVEGWLHLMILHYLDLADGAPLTGTWINFGSLRDGVIRGTKFDRDAERDLAAFLRGRSPGDVRRCFGKIGAEEMQGRGDLCVRIPFLPRCPMLVNIWFEDEEFPASGKILLDSAADHYLTVEDAVTAGTLVLELLRPEKEQREI